MRAILPKNLILLANACDKPLYVVGGSARDFLANLSAPKWDWDICAPLSADEFADIAQKCGFQIKSVFKHTGTVKLQDADRTEYEYTCFRSDKYVRGVHSPVEIYQTDDIVLDAKRRDFTANAVYYDIQKDTFVDPLDGISAIREKRLSTVAPAQKVFGEDGLRLMRLARQSAKLGFTPDEECLDGAKQNAELILDISAERIFAELNAILSADETYGNKQGVYTGLKLLEETGVLAHILPELALGKNMKQRADFHKYDVLEHSLKCAFYAPKHIRLAALLHDVGKPFCYLRDGRYHAHPVEGARLAREILTRWKAPKKETERVCKLVETHMYDLDCKVKENKLRRFLVAHYDLLDDLLLLKQADFSACMDDTSVAPTCRRWEELLQRMRAENTPFSLKDLAVNGNDLLAEQIPPQKISEVLQRLLMHTAIYPQENENARLRKLAIGFLNA